MDSPTLQGVLSASEDVQRTFAALLASVGIDRPSMSELRERLGFDKSVASRLARAIRSNDPGAAVRDLPGTETLERLVSGCERLGAKPSRATAARAAIARLDAAISAFPGDRISLAAAVANSMADSIAASGSDRAPAAPVSPARMKAARRGAYDAFLFAQGIRCETQACITIHAPGRTPGRADQAMVMATTGLRRLRPGNPFAVLSLQGHPDPERIYRRTTLDGVPVVDDPGVALLREFCSPSASRLRLEGRGRFHSLVLDPEVPPLDEPMDLAYGLINTDFMGCRATPDDRWTLTTYTVSRPTRLLLREVLLHRATFGGCVPEAIFSIETVPQARPEVEGPDRTHRGVVDHGADFVAMGAGFARHGKPDHDFAVPMALRAFELLGHDPADFDRFRMVIEYPLPLVRGEAWLRLPD